MPADVRRAKARDMPTPFRWRSPVREKHVPVDRLAAPAIPPTSAAMPVHDAAARIAEETGKASGASPPPPRDAGDPFSLRAQPVTAGSGIGERPPVAAAARPPGAGIDEARRLATGDPARARRLLRRAWPAAGWAGMRGGSAFREAPPRGLSSTGPRRPSPPSRASSSPRRPGRAAGGNDRCSWRAGSPRISPGRGRSR